MVYRRHRISGTVSQLAKAIPFVGWAFKAIAMAATVLQLGQTEGEVAGSPRVVEFDPLRPREPDKTCHRGPPRLTGQIPRLPRG